MKPLRGVLNPRTGLRSGESVVERRGGPIVRRDITGAERADICGQLFVKGWRATGCEAEAVRARIGQDFNDAIQEGIQ
ncbi:hypothetical protein ADT71_19835 [Novosphingobium sp. ST904]|nr:hypothetical protein ADT71_19835 [Novosphingobium sp. ST904]